MQLQGAAHIQLSERPPRRSGDSRCVRFSVAMLAASRALRSPKGNPGLGPLRTRAAGAGRSTDLPLALSFAAAEAAARGVPLAGAAAAALGVPPCGGSACIARADPAAALRSDCSRTAGESERGGSLSAGGAVDAARSE